MRNGKYALGLIAALGGLTQPAAADPGDAATPLSDALTYVRQLLRPAPRLTALHHQVTLGPADAALILELDNDGALVIELVDGTVRVDDAPVARYRPGGPFESSWRELMTDLTRVATPEAVARVRDWEPRGLQGDDAKAARQVRSQTQRVEPTQGRPAPQVIPRAGPEGLVLDLQHLTDLTALEPSLLQAARLQGDALRLTVPNGMAWRGDYSIGSGEQVAGPVLVLHGNADIYGRLTGNLVAIDGDIIVHPGAMVQGDVLAYGGHIHDVGGDITGEIHMLGTPQALPVEAAAEPPATALALALRNGAGLVGVFLSLCALGFGLVLFGRPNLEIVSDTVSHSFGRAFVVGLLGQILVLPTFGMLVVGLILSVAGILLLPFAVVAYALLVVVAALGGFLAVAHAMGETYTRRRMAAGATLGSPNSYRYLLVGLAGILSLWAAWVIFGWVPVAGGMIQFAAILLTWLLGTAGFGAALLSRAGAREHFAGRIIPPEALTDEYLWATPQFGVPAARRPGHRTPPPGL